MFLPLLAQAFLPVPTGSPLGGPRRPAELWGARAQEPAGRTWPLSPRWGPQMLILSSSRCLWESHRALGPPTEAGPSPRAPRRPVAPARVLCLAGEEGTRTLSRMSLALTSPRRRAGILGPSLPLSSRQVSQCLGELLSPQGDFCEHFQSGLGVSHQESTLSSSTAVVPLMFQERAVTPRHQRPSRHSPRPTEGVANVAKAGVGGGCSEALSSPHLAAAWLLPPARPLGPRPCLWSQDGSAGSPATVKVKPRACIWWILRTRPQSDWNASVPAPGVVLSDEAPRWPRALCPHLRPAGGSLGGP